MVSGFQAFGSPERDHGSLLSGQQFFDNVPGDIGQAVFAALKTKCQLRVIHAHEAKDGSVQIVNLDGILDHAITEFVSLAKGDARFNSASGQPLCFSGPWHLKQAA